MPVTYLLPKALRGTSIEDALGWCAIALVWALFFIVLDALVLSQP